LISFVTLAGTIGFASLWWFESQEKHDLTNQLGVGQSELNAERARFGELVEQKSRTEGELENLQSELRGVRSDLNKERQISLTVTAQLGEAKSNVSSLSNDLEKLREEISNQRQQLGTLLAQVEEASRRVTIAESELVSSGSQNIQQQTTMSELWTELSATKDILKNVQNSNDGLLSDFTTSIVELAALQVKLDSLLLPTPIGTEPVVISGTLTKLNLVSIPIDLSAQQEVKGEVICGRVPCEPYIQNPSGQSVHSFGRIVHSNFSFVAKVSGTYSLVVQNPFSDANDYRVSYPIFSIYQTP
jgi:hypothetical protein